MFRMYKTFRNFLFKLFDEFSKGFPIIGVSLALIGVIGLACGGILWNFSGRSIGLITTITSLVIIAVSFVVLKPFPQEPLVNPDFDYANLSLSDNDQSTSLKYPLASFTGYFLGVLGSLGLAISSILWKFKGFELGLTGTITSITALFLAFIFLIPITRKNSQISEQVSTKTK